MSKKLYARVSASFDPEAFTGVLIASERFRDTYGFTEAGYDTADYNVPPIVREVVSKVTLYASANDVYEAAKTAGIQVWETLEGYLKNWPGAKAEHFEEGVYPAIDDSEPNQLLERAEVRSVLTEAGFDAFRDYVTVGNEQPLFHAFWNRSAFDVSAPLELAPKVSGRPYDVKLVQTGPSPSP